MKSYMLGDYEASKAYLAQCVFVTKWKHSLNHEANQSAPTSSALTRRRMDERWEHFVFQ